MKFKQPLIHNAFLELTIPDKLWDQIQASKGTGWFPVNGLNIEYSPRVNYQINE